MPPLEERVEYPYQNIRVGLLSVLDMRGILILTSTRLRTINGGMATRPCCMFSHPSHKYYLEARYAICPAR